MAETGDTDTAAGDVRLPPGDAGGLPPGRGAAGLIKLPGTDPGEAGTMPGDSDAPARGLLTELPPGLASAASEDGPACKLSGRVLVATGEGMAGLAGMAAAWGDSGGVVPGDEGEAPGRTGEAGTGIPGMPEQ